MVKRCILALLYQIGVWVTSLGYPVWVIEFWVTVFDVRKVHTEAWHL